MTPLLMIPGPIEVSEAVARAVSGPPPGHVSPQVIEAFGCALENMRRVWLARPDAQPFVVPGSGTLAMEMAVTNLLDPGQRALVVNTGYFSDRMGEMLARRGVEVTHLRAAPGGAPSVSDVEIAIGSAADERKPFHAMFATHVDTSTGVRVDARALIQAARVHEVLTVFDGVCATAGERFEMASWGAGVYLTASQKAIGLPPGLALMVVSQRALEARRRLRTKPPMSVDMLEWLPIMQAYEARRPSYFSTPATNLIMGLDITLKEILAMSRDEDLAMATRVRLHELAAEAFRASWEAMGLRMVPAAGLEANTLSAVRYPEGVDATLIGKVREQGVIIAGGLHPAIKDQYFRVGHMGHVLTHPDDLVRTVNAVEAGLIACGLSIERGVARRAFIDAFG